MSAQQDPPRQPVEPDSLTTEPLSFSRQTGLDAMTPKLDMQTWDVDPELVIARLNAVPQRVARE